MTTETTTTTATNSGGSSVNALPSEETLSHAKSLSVTDSTGQSHTLSEIFDSASSKVLILIFVRHYHCGMCMQYLQDLLAHPSSSWLKTKSGKEVQFIVIGHGSYKNIDRYADLTGCAKASVPIYSDEKHTLFKALGVTNQAKGLPDHSPRYAQGKGNYTIVWESLVEMATSPWRLIWSGGDFKQLGAEFVFDQGKPIYAHRMVHSADHTEVEDLLKIAGVV